MLNCRRAQRAVAVIVAVGALILAPHPVPLAKAGDTGGGEQRDCAPRRQTWELLHTFDLRVDPTPDPRATSTSVSAGFQDGWASSDACNVLLVGNRQITRTFASPPPPGAPLHDDEGIALRSDDGGVTFAPVTLPSEVPVGYLQRIAFITDREGWIGGGTAVPNRFGESGTSIQRPLLFHTTDGGETWNETGVPPRSGRILALAATSTTIWVGIDRSAWMSTDDGATWSEQVTIPVRRYNGPLSGDPAPISGASIAAIAVKGSSVLVGGFNGDNVVIFVSTDDGRMFVQGTVPNDFGRSRVIQLRQIALPTAERAYAVDTSQIIRSDDGGLTWERLWTAPPALGFIYGSLRFVSADVGFIGHPTSVTRDGGRTWQLLDPTLAPEANPGPYIVVSEHIVFGYDGTSLYRIAP